MPLPQSAKSKVGLAQRRKLSFAAISVDYESFPSGDGHRRRTCVHPSRRRLKALLRGCESFHYSDLILRSPSEARASRRMAASSNLLPWFETARCARLLTMRPRELKFCPQDEAEVCFWATSAGCRALISPRQRQWVGC